MGSVRSDTGLCGLYSLVSCIDKEGSISGVTESESSGQRERERSVVISEE